MSYPTYKCSCAACIADPDNKRLVINYDYHDHCTEHEMFKEIKEWCESLSGEECVPRESTATHLPVGTGVFP